MSNDTLLDIHHHRVRQMDLMNLGIHRIISETIKYVVCLSKKLSKCKTRFIARYKM